MGKCEGSEWCPYCDTENEYSVSSRTWFIECENCGRPLLLCDKCGMQDSCDACPHEQAAHARSEKYERSLVGRRVWWDDPHDGLCSGYGVITAVDDALLKLKKDDGGEAEVWIHEVDFHMEEQNDTDERRG